MKNALNDLLSFEYFQNKHIFSLYYFEIIAIYVIKFPIYQCTWHKIISFLLFRFTWMTHISKCTQKSTSTYIYIHHLHTSKSNLQFPAWHFVACFFGLADIKTAYRMQCWRHKIIVRHQVEFPFEWQRILKTIWCHKMDQRLLNMPPIHRLSIQILIYHRCKCKPFSKYKVQCST